MPVKKIVSSLLAFCFAFTSSLSYAETATVTLKKGKNYIAVPAMTKAWTTADLAKGVGAGFVESWLYDGSGATPAYTHYRVGQELMADFLSVPASGGVCVIVVNADSTLTLPNVAPEALREFSASKGWHLIGWTNKNAPPVADALRPLAQGTDYDEVRWFDPGTQTWKSSAEVDATGFATVQPYQAYAVHLLGSSSVALGAISINSAATYTKSASVSVTLRAPSGYTQYALSNTTTLPSTGTALSTPVSWTLSAGEGAKTVYAQFFKADGTASGVYSAMIMLDATAPTIISAKAKGKSKVRVVFSEALAATPTASNFTITPSLTVSSVTKESDTSYVLALSTPSDTTSTYTLTASGITDASGNAVASGSVTFDRKPIETIYLYQGSTRIAKKENGVTTYLLQDHLGSTVATADSAGKLLSRTTYTPYGSVASESGDTDSHKFTGKELDPSTGLYDYEARQYDAGLGRFISADTATPNYSDPQTLNRYSYCRNNPMKYVDPTGHVFETPFDLAALAVSTWIYIADPSPATFAAVALDALAAATPGVPALGGMAIRAEKSAVAIARALKTETKIDTIVIGKKIELEGYKTATNEKHILKEMPNRGSFKANWKQNSSVLRKYEKAGYDIKDIGTQNTGFLKAERNLLENRGRTFDSKTKKWVKNE